MANVQDVANYLLFLDQQEADEEVGNISNLKLQKLAYYAQGFFAALNDGKPLFESRIEAWTHGPVVVELYHQYKGFGANPIPFDEKSGFDLADEEADLIQEVFQVFSQFSPWKLRNMTHEESPWLNHSSEAGEIPVDEMAEYFKTRLK
ncbi:hypothetical protein BGP77_16635 [Saccharospirillum sp. MSK14-1]|uniref:Panacea domain-containing protein n=1 Tax=Saccharospirillum sp. MSK14-1 TaxID=1897632 RepID=UPI000D38F2CE|nr:type II toxin-antitoxin system antitoxin SocA domain-containing protein [Saccharospirillum sp. MSK14-1]PTY38078.1 hypothetical protein BGP77_16635 [Saccharospirillum sp. MSK14-1]